MLCDLVEKFRSERSIVLVGYICIFQVVCNSDAQFYTFCKFQPQSPQTMCTKPPNLFAVCGRIYLDTDSPKAFSFHSDRIEEPFRFESFLLY